MTSGRSMSGRRFFCVLAASALSLISAAQASAETLRVATPYPAVNFHTQNLQAFATAVSSATNGGLKLEVLLQDSPHFLKVVFVAGHLEVVNVDAQG